MEQRRQLEEQKKTIGGSEETLDVAKETLGGKEETLDGAKKTVGGYEETIKVNLGGTNQIWRKTIGDRRQKEILCNKQIIYK